MHLCEVLVEGVRTARQGKDHSGSHVPILLSQKRYRQCGALANPPILWDTPPRSERVCRTGLFSSHAPPSEPTGASGVNDFPPAGNSTYCGNPVAEQEYYENHSGAGFEPETFQNEPVSAILSGGPLNRCAKRIPGS
jgi:hypothetical protein